MIVLPSSADSIEAHRYDEGERSLAGGLTNRVDPTGLEILLDPPVRHGRIDTHERQEHDVPDVSRRHLHDEGADVALDVRQPRRPQQEHPVDAVECVAPRGSVHEVETDGVADSRLANGGTDRRAGRSKRVGQRSTDVAARSGHQDPVAGEVRELGERGLSSIIFGVLTADSPVMS